ncbi:MAG TPA: cobalt-precorrin-5B (C(1))-methyltransferase, partial [Campylobacterales bacterium]|nr:cobalt-precorrin-5B (C(1))-methyltransferase [Campylobacterales bacterium]
SIKTELNFAKSNGFEEVILTLGNSSFVYAKENYQIEQIVEIGNFVYDSFEIAQELGIKKAILVCGIGKATKVMQGCKNTHNRFGSIDFEALKNDIDKNLGIEVNIESTKTVKGLSMQLNRIGLLDEFYKMVEIKSKEKIQEWFSTLNTDIRILK